MELISRDEAIKQIEEAFDMGDCNCDRFALRGILKSLPTIEERKEGRWIADKWENIWKMEVNCYRCSNCGIRAIDHSLIMNIVGLNYCPHCGAKMIGE